MMTMLDRILYFFASPQAREIIDSLEHEPGEWEPRKSGQGVVTVLHHDAFGSVYTPDSFLWGFSDGLKSCCFDNRSRLALRRAVNEWRNTHG